MIEQKKSIFRFFRLPLQKEQDAEEAFGRLSKVLHELDIPVLYSANILQEIFNHKLWFLSSNIG